MPCLPAVTNHSLSRDRVINCFLELQREAAALKAQLAASGSDSGSGGSLYSSSAEAATAELKLAAANNAVQQGGYGNLFALVPSKLRAEDIQWSGACEGGGCAVLFCAGCWHTLLVHFDLAARAQGWLRGRCMPHWPVWVAPHRLGHSHSPAARIV